MLGWYPPLSSLQVLDTQEASVGGALMGSSHTYVIPGQKKAPAGKIGDVDITLRPEELEGLDEDAIKKKYEQFQEAEKEVGVARSCQARFWCFHMPSLSRN